MFTLNRTSTTPLFQQLSEFIRHDIEHRIITIGARLPSVRVMAKDCQVSLITVINAYNRLVAEGYLKPKKASGYYACCPSRKNTLPMPALIAQVDSEWLLSHVFSDEKAHLLPGCGWLPDHWLEGTQIRHALSVLSRKTSNSLVNYGNPYGHLPLRKVLQLILHGKAIDAHPEHIILTQGASQALSLCARLFLKPGDTVFVDDPMYANLIAMLRTHGYHIIGVPRTTTGPDPEQLELLAAQHRPRAFFTNTSLHNPTGTTTSIATAHRIVRAAEQFDFQIVEDDIFSDLNMEHSVTLAALDQLNRVTYVGSLSKSISPSLRVGFIATNADKAKDFALKKMLDGLTSSEINEKLASIILTEGRHRLSIQRLRTRCAEAQRTVATQLINCGMTLFHQPSGGMFLWARFARNVDATKVARHAAESGLVLAPGQLFDAENKPNAWMRFNVGYSDQAEIYQYLEHINKQTSIQNLLLNN